MQLNANKRTLQDEINNVFHIKDDFEETYKFAIYPIICAFETALNRDLLLESEKKRYYFAFDSKEIIKSSLKERFEVYQLAKQCGLMTINEMRKAENMNTVDGLDVINLGLDSVLYNTQTGEIYTPNTDSTKPAQPADQMGFPSPDSEQDRAANGKTVAVDYDETIAHNGSPKPEVVDKLKALQAQGAKIMLWTARTGKDRQDAIDRCADAGLTFDGVLDSKPDADVFVDDKATTAKGILKTGAGM